MLSVLQAGQERFRTLSTSFYRGAHAVLLVYDISSRASFLTMERWFEEVHNNTVPEVALYLVGTKLDKVELLGRAVSVEEGEALAKEHGAAFCEASAKTRENVRKPFVEVVDAVVGRPGLLDAAGAGKKAGVVRVGETEGEQGWLGGCAC